MNRQTFILLKKKTFRHNLKLFVKDSEGKTDRRTIPFTTEHLVRDIDRAGKARKTLAEYSTTDEVIYDALLRDSGYGKVFTLKSDPEGKLKKEPLNITPLDAEKIALRNLFANSNLPFDDKKSNAVLREELTIYIQAQTGKEIKQSTAKEIPGTPVNVLQTLQEQVDQAISDYEEETGNDFPEFETKSDMYNFIDGLKNPEFNQEKFIKEHSVEKNSSGDDLPDDAEELGKLYQGLFDTNVPNPKKNNVDWIKGKIKEKQAE
jgi:hypothetical protein